MSLNEEISTVCSPSSKNSNAHTINYNYNTPNDVTPFKIKKKLHFSKEITVVFVNSFKEYNKEKINYESKKVVFKNKEKNNCYCQCMVF